MKPVLLVTRKLPEPVEARIAAGYDARFNRDGAPLGSEALIAQAAGADGILCTILDRLSAPVIAALPASLRIIATFSVGADHIDLQAAKARGIAVTNTPGALTEATADIAFLLLLGAARRAQEGETLVRSGAWRGWTPTQLLGAELYGKRLGIVGMGRIGQAMARRAQGFGLELHYTGRRPRDLPAGLTACYHPSEDTFLPLCDFLSLHLASAPETRRWLNGARIARLPKGAIVVNSARGDLVDDEALIAALRSGQVAAAGLDVFSGEPDIDPRYRTLANTMLLPHLGSATVETRCAMGFRALDNLDAFFAGAALPDRIA